ncbi:MAG: hypothetical protein LBS01_03710 [Prevotellaceae bacterium]|jgi:hypothetical protein|nr:hypothetical protein [Prevotellaceae bacterium]
MVKIKSNRAGKFVSKLKHFLFVALCSFGLCIIPIGILYTIAGKQVDKIYPVKSEGLTEQFLSQNQIGYYSPNVIKIFGIELYRAKKGTFIYRAYNTDKYLAINQATIDEYKLRPDFTFWQRYGIYIILIPLPLLVAIFITFQTDDDNYSGDADIDVPDDERKYNGIEIDYSHQNSNEIMF